VDFYERLAGFHFALVMMRIDAMNRALDPQRWQPGMAVDNPVARLTKELIGIA
jgi:hypothetical protein